MTIQRGETFHNPRCRETVTVRSPADASQGRRTVLDVWAEPGGAVSGLHLHPLSEERFTLVSGRLVVEIEGRQVTLSECGDSVLIPAGLRHQWWNAGGKTSHHVCEFRNRADRFEELVLRQLFSLAQDGKTDRNGRPNLLAQAVTTLEYGDVVRFSSPPWLVQRLLFGLVSPLAHRRGYRGRNPAYLQRSSPERRELPELPDAACRWHFTADGRDPFALDDVAEQRS